MKNLLVPVDFSEQSISAFRLALDIAAQSHGIIQLLHVITLPALRDSPTMPIAAFKKKELLDELKDETAKKFSRIINEFNAAKIHIDTNIVTGRVHSSIADFIEKEKIDLVLMGTKGATGLTEWVVGSNTEKIVRTSPVPVIAIKNYKPGTSIKSIVFPNTLDNRNQEALVMEVKALQHFFGATLHIIWVNTPALFKPDHEIRQHLTSFAKRYMLKDYTLNVFNYTSEESGILEFTRLINADLIAMGTHGLTGLAHLLLGSIAEDVVNHVRNPVWTYCTKSARALLTQKQPDGLLR